MAARTNFWMRIWVLIFERYLDPNTGFWVNQLDRNNQSIAAEIPVRVLYHLFLAFAEVCRVKNSQR